MTQLDVYAFSPAWSLPSSGPFANKLLAWLRLSGIPHQVRIEDDSRKGPKGKNPWIVLDGERIGDTELILARLSAERPVSIDDWLSPEQGARALVLSRMVEEHLHQLFEYELIVHDAGYPVFRSMVTAQLPPVIGPMVSGMVRSHFRKQLHARGIARHQPDEITALGQADLDALSTLLGDQRWFLGDQPCSADCAVWGQLAPFVMAPLDTPVAQHARTRGNLAAWAHRVRDELFPEIVQARAA